MSKKTIPLEWGNYISGFVDGEGSFVITIKKRQDHTLGWQIIFAFSVSQRELYILSQLKKYLGCGTITERQDGLHTYAVTNPLALNEKIIPFFEQFRFRSIGRRENFFLFKKALKIWMDKKQLTYEEVRRVAEIRENLNKGAGRKRKYSIEDIQSSFKEDPQRPYARPRLFRKENHSG